MRTILQGIKVFFGILLGYEQRLDEFTKSYKEYQDFINTNMILVDNKKVPMSVPNANRTEIVKKWEHLMKLRYKVESKLKIAR